MEKWGYLIVPISNYGREITIGDDRYEINL